MSAVGDARKRAEHKASNGTQPADDAAAFIRRLINAWDCCGTCAGGVLAARDRDLLAEARAEERERVAQAIEAVRSPSLSLTEIGHLDHAARTARTEAGS